MFLGSHNRTIDSKGRLILPPSFRSRLANGAVMTPLDSCLGILPAAEFERMAQKLEAEVSEGSVDINALRSFASEATQVVPDAQGRILLLPRLREIADLEKTVIVAGAFARVEVWNTQRWAEIKAAGTEKLAQAITQGRGIGKASIMVDSQ
ncbi:MAG: division/cell wall cluster transcriptional repressor MraZ [Acidimicrobiaceae bacterium]|nr:division/cell wall cluster transcriptional repressor MraZ [Acidimicrobiaceae bacterium]